MDHQPVDLAALVEEVHGRLKVLADHHSIHLQLGLLEPVTVHGDHERLRRLLLNLVENGIKHTRAGGRVTLSLQRQGSWALLRVADTGIGLAEAEHEQIFQPFYRSAEALTLSEPGVGLGLSIARSIALAHGGSIQVSSTPGHGSVFTVRIPMRDFELFNNNLHAFPFGKICFAMVTNCKMFHPRVVDEADGMNLIPGRVSGHERGLLIVVNGSWQDRYRGASIPWKEKAFGR